MSVRVPRLGQMVVYLYGDDEPAINGTREHPAVIVRVWSPTEVNLRVLTDGGAIDWVSRAKLATKAGAKGARHWAWG
jgi:hypothetical protein